MNPSHVDGLSPARNLFARITSGATLFLIFAGGLVTSTGSGLAVPDWPLSYGMWFPPMVGGVFYEHGHRMIAGTVGLMTAVLAIWTWVSEDRRWVRRFAGVALATVVVQALLGGITVLYLLPTPVSVFHACLAQTFFCLTVVLAIVTGRPWLSREAPRSEDPALSRLSAVVFGAVFVQLGIGAVMRHTGSGLAIPDFPLAFGRVVPPLESFGVTIHFLHRAWGLAVAILSLAAVAHVLFRHRSTPRLVRIAALLGALVTVQIGLGALAIWSARAVLPTTLHVATGAAILATSLVLAIRARTETPAPSEVAVPFLRTGERPA